MHNMQSLEHECRQPAVVVVVVKMNELKRIDWQKARQSWRKEPNKYSERRVQCQRRSETLNRLLVGAEQSNS